MKVLFIERSPTTTVSLEKVFREVAQQLTEKGIEVEFQQMPFGNNLLGIIKNLLFFKPQKADIFHITGHIHYIALKLPKYKTVLTVHDLRILHDRNDIRRSIIKYLFFDLPVKRLKYLTVISKATKLELINETKCDENKISIIENPVSKVKDEIKFKEFNQTNPVILQVGTASHKNIPNLITALKGINCTLKIIGKLEPKFSELLRYIRYENVNDLNEEEMQNAYSDADIVSFCSTYEGFGLPIIEAQMFGKPLITSKLSPMKEVAGEGACLVNPLEIEDIRSAILKIISDEDYRKAVVLQGFNNIKRFDSNKITQQYADLYKKIVIN